MKTLGLVLGGLLSSTAWADCEPSVEFGGQGQQYLQGEVAAFPFLLTNACAEQNTVDVRTWLKLGEGQFVVMDGGQYRINLAPQDSVQDTLHWTVPADLEDGFVELGIRLSEPITGAEINVSTTRVRIGDGPSFEVLATMNGVNVYRVPVTGAMTDVNLKAMCVAAGLNVACYNNQPDSTYNDSDCVVTGSRGTETMRLLATELCSNSSPGSCDALEGFLYI